MIRPACGRTSLSPRWQLLAASAVGLFSLCQTVIAADAGKYPERPIRVIVPFAPGGTSDFAARIVGQGMTEQLGQPAVLDTRSAGGGILGIKLAIEAIPDGYTILLNNLALAVNETMRPDRGYVALKQLTPISLVGVTPSILVVNNNTPYKNMAEFFSGVRAQPGKIPFGSAGTGSSTHLAMAYLLSAAKIDLLHVPYKGGGPAIVALLAGEVHCVLSPVPTVVGQIKGGRIRALAVSGSKRASSFPDLPTMAEAGVAGYEFTTWFGLVAPMGTPKAIIDRLNRAVIDIVRTPDVAQKMQAAGLEPQPTTPTDYGAFMQAEIVKWRKVIEDAGIPKG